MNHPVETATGHKATIVHKNNSSLVRVQSYSNCQEWTTEYYGPDAKQAAEDYAAQYDHNPQIFNRS